MCTVYPDQQRSAGHAHAYTTNLGLEYRKMTTGRNPSGCGPSSCSIHLVSLIKHALHAGLRPAAAERLSSALPSRAHLCGLCCPVDLAVPTALLLSTLKCLLRHTHSSTINIALSRTLRRLGRGWSKRLQVSGANKRYPGFNRPFLTSGNRCAQQPSRAPVDKSDALDARHVHLDVALFRCNAEVRLLPTLRTDVFNVQIFRRSKYLRRRRRFGFGRRLEIV